MTFDEYVYARGPALMRFARLLTGDEHRAEDLVQEVLAKAYASWRRISRTDRPDLYVRRMLVNSHRSWWRRLTNREVAVGEMADSPRPEDRPHDVAERDALWRLVTALPERQRTALVLRYYEDLDDGAIAEVMQCAPATVRSHVRRALERLRAAVPTLADEPKVGELR